MQEIPAMNVLALTIAVGLSNAVYGQTGAHHDSATHVPPQIGHAHNPHDGAGVPAAYDVTEPQPKMPALTVNGQAWPVTRHKGSQTATVDLAFITGFDADSQGKMLDRFWAHAHPVKGVEQLITVELQRHDSRWQLPTGLEVRFVLRGVPISSWSASPSFAFKAADLGAVSHDGVHHLTFELRGVDAIRFNPGAIQVHIHRGDRPTSVFSPVFGGASFDGHPSVPPVAYIDVNRRWRIPTFKINPGNAPPFTVVDPRKLYSYPVGVTNRWPTQPQMVWVEPSASPHQGLRFTRRHPVKNSESIHDLFTRFRHSAWLGADGEPGQALLTGYAGGVTLPDGSLVFAETNGRYGTVSPAGEIKTLGGWVNRGPAVWGDKELSAARERATLVGTELKLPLDVAPWGDFFLIADYEADQIVIDKPGGTSFIVPLFKAASVAVSPGGRAVAVSLEGHEVVEIFPEGSKQTLLSPLPNGVIPTNWDDSASAAAVNRVAMLKNPMRTWLPQWVRWLDDDTIILMELGTQCIRKIHLPTQTSTIIEITSQKFGTFHRGWASFAVSDGTCGPKGTIYWIQSEGNQYRGATTQRTNRLCCWIPPGATTTVDPATGLPTSPPVSKWLFGDNPENPTWGVLDRAACPHYPWLIACGSGRIWVGGIGMLNAVCIRSRSPDDYVLPATLGRKYRRGWELYSQTSAATVFGEDGRGYLYGDALRGTESLSDIHLLEKLGLLDVAVTLSESDFSSLLLYLRTEAKKP